MVEKKRYQCEVCGYEFESVRLPKLCPYCGKENSVKPLKSATEILREISEVEEEK
jgi:rubrerythrin